MTDIYLIRHAEADGNIYRRAHGHYDGYITDNGYKQIEALRARFANVHIDRVYASDLFRTQATAKAIYEGRGIPFDTRPALREICLGKWEDLPWGELIDKYPDEYDIWVNHPSQFTIKGGETHAVLFARMKACLDEIVCENPGKTVAVVSHGVAIRALLCGLIYSDLSRVTDICWCDNTAVAHIIVYDDLKYDVKFFNDNSHLASLSTLEKQRWWRNGDDGRAYNVYFENAALPRDALKCDEYYGRAWVEIFGDLDYDKKTCRAHIRRLASHHTAAIAFARLAGTEIGAIMLDVRAKLFPDGGHISLLYLNEEYRNRGFGAQLLGHAVSIYRALGRKYLTVRVAATNAHAIAFYKKHGFLEFARESDADVHQILMRKQIYFEIRN
ncbi:MAG: GNAT family N-acetyltransferase [Clostridia bacterium]